MRSIIDLTMRPFMRSPMTYIILSFGADSRLSTPSVHIIDKYPGFLVTIKGTFLVSFSF